MKIRFARIYVLVVASVVLGVGSRFAYTMAGFPLFDKPWPSGLWSGPIPWTVALSHLLPTGLVATNDFNYAIWYLYHELRLILLFPLFRWVLQGGGARMVGAILGTLLVATIGEHYCFDLFPLFRTSPFLTLGYGFIFLVGVATWSFQKWMKRRALVPGRAVAAAAIFVGLGIGYLEPFGIRPPFQSPPLQNVQIALSQMLVFLGLCWSLQKISIPPWLSLATQWSVGIYIVHPPIHQLAAHAALVAGHYWILWLVPVLSIPFGAIFFHWVVEPVSGWLRIVLAGNRGQGASRGSD